MADTRNAVRRDVGDVYSDVRSMQDWQLLEAYKGLYVLRRLLEVSCEDVRTVLAAGAEALLEKLEAIAFDGMDAVAEGDELTLWIALVSSMVNLEMAERQIGHWSCDDET